MWGLVGVALAAPRLDSIDGALYDGGGVRVAKDGTVHLLVSPKATRLSVLKGIVNVTADGNDEVTQKLLRPKVRHIVVLGDGTRSEVEIPGPGGEWPHDAHVHEAVLDLTADDVPVVAMLGERCPGANTPCMDRLWLAVHDGTVFRTKELATKPGGYVGLTLYAGSNEGPITATQAILTDGSFTGIVRFVGTGAMEPWVAGGKQRPHQIVAVDGTLGVLYRKQGEMYLHSAAGETLLGDGARHRGDAVWAQDHVVHQYYNADKKSLVGGTAGMPSAAVDGPESGWFNALTTDTTGAPVAAWYYYKNAYNKGIRVASKTGTDWETWTQVRDDAENIGWGLDLDIGADGTLALAAHNRSTHEVELRVWPSLDAARGETIAPAGDWTDRRRSSFLFAYGGGWFNQAAIATAPPSEEDFDFGDIPVATGRYGLQPGLAIEGGFAGKIGPVNLVAEYLRRNEDSEAVQTLGRLQNLMLKLGIDDLPAPDTEMQLHFRAADLAGVYTDPAGEAQGFQSDDTQLELRYVGKAGYHFGLRYHGFRGPQDVFTSFDHEILEHRVADAKFTEGSVVVGWAVIDYLKKYEISYFGPYFDVQVGAGLVNVGLDFDVGQDSAIALTFPAGADLGLVAYKRFRAMQGAGGFVRLGGRGTAQYLGAGEPEERDAERTEPYLNFTRLDARFGPYLNAGLVF